MDKNKAKATSAATDKRTRKEKLADMAKQTASPAEAKVALSKLGSTPEGRLEAIAIDIKAEWGKGIEAQFAIGRLLIEAHQLMPDDREYGRWVAEQNFPFKRGTAFLLQRGAEREPEVRALITARVQENERDIGVPYAIQLLTAGPAKRTAHAAPELPAEPVNPAFAALRSAHNLIVTDGGFEDMHVDDLATCATYIKELAAAYNEAKAARAA